MSNREYMIISYKTDPEAVRRWVPELLQPDDNIHLSWVKTESSGAHAPHTIVSHSANVRPAKPLSVSYVSCVVCRVRSIGYGVYQKMTASVGCKYNGEDCTFPLMAIVNWYR
jgi:hypothetical protein